MYRFHCDEGRGLRRGSHGYTKQTREVPGHAGYQASEASGRASCREDAVIITHRRDYADPGSIVRETHRIPRLRQRTSVWHVVGMV